MAAQVDQRSVPVSYVDERTHRRLIANLLNLIGKRQSIVYDDLSASADATIESEEIPSWARRVVLSFTGLTNSTSNNILIQLYDTAVVTTGYNSCSTRLGTGAVTSGVTNGIVISVASSADVFHGEVALTKMAGDIWAASINLARSDTNATVTGGGQATLSDLLTKLRINGNGGNITGTIGVRVER